MPDRTKITMAGARAFAAADGREAVLWDSAAPGLGLRARANGRKTWIVHRRCNGSVVRRTLGALDALTVRGCAARALLADAETHGTPAAVPTVRTFAPAFLADCAERWKPATRRAHADGMNRYILPAFGDRRVDAIGAKDVRNWFDDLSATRAGSANRALAVLSSMSQHAEALGLRREDSNTCKGVRRRKTGFEAYYLTDDEFAALGRALDDAEAEWPVAVAALCFLLYTGARRSEALRLKWEHVHGDRAVLPDSKTGPRTIWLGVARARDPRSAATAQRLPLGVRVAVRRACLGGQGMERDPREREYAIHDTALQGFMLRVPAQRGALLGVPLPPGDGTPRRVTLGKPEAVKAGPGAGRRARLPRAREGRREARAASRFRPDAGEVRRRICRAARTVVEAVHGGGHQ